MTRYGRPCRSCGATPTRVYKDGPSCALHTPAALAGRPEPPDPKASVPPPSPPRSQAGRYGAATVGPGDLSRFRNQGQGAG